MAAQRVVQAICRGLERQQPLGEQPAPAAMLFQPLYVLMLCSCESPSVGEGCLSFRTSWC